MSDNGFNAALYVEQAAKLLGIEIPSEALPGVIANLERSAAIARPLLEFPLPDDAEAGPVFRP